MTFQPSANGVGPSTNNIDKPVNGLAGITSSSIIGHGRVQGNGQINAEAGPSRPNRSPTIGSTSGTASPSTNLPLPVPIPSSSSSSSSSGAPASAASAPIPAFLSRILSTHKPSPLPISSPTTTAEPRAAPQPLYLPPPAVPEIEEDLVPPENFALVCPGVYRSGFPKKRNFRFMETLGLKTILTLVLEDYPEANLKWCQANNVQFMQFGIPGNKEPFDNIPEDVITSALCAILDKRNHPLLIHCNKGKHRTGCLVGCIRRTQSWSLTSIFDEYRRFSEPKSRAVDQQFIDLFDLDPVWDEMLSGAGLAELPSWSMLSVPLRVRKSGKSTPIPAIPLVGDTVEQVRGVGGAVNGALAAVETEKEKGEKKTQTGADADGSEPISGVRIEGVAGVTNIS